MRLTAATNTLAVATLAPFRYNPISEPDFHHGRSMPTPYSSGATRFTPLSGINRVDSLLLSRRWGSGSVGAPTSVSFSFAGPASLWHRDYDSAWTTSREPHHQQMRALTSKERARFRQVMDLWAEVADIQVVEIGDNDSSAGDIRVAFSGAVNDEGSIAWSYPPADSAVGGDIWLNPMDPGLKSELSPGGDGFHTLLHEIGHALGLSHPFDGRRRLPAAQDNFQFTVMSYDDHPGASTYPTTPMLYDVAAMQYLYGPNPATRADDTEYTFAPDRETLMTLWDAAGTDRLNASNQLGRVVLRLAQGAFSSVGPTKVGGRAKNNLAIAFGAEIENAVGSRFADRLRGNRLANRLEGRRGSDILLGLNGADRLFGHSGDDRLSGGGGTDILAGGQGSDTLTGGAAADRFRFDRPAQGHDTIDDFRRAQGDRLVLRASGFEQLKTGPLATVHFVANRNGLAREANDYLVFNTRTQTLFFDPDGNGRVRAQPIASLKNRPGLRASDILVVA